MLHYLKILLLIIPLFFVNSACNSVANEAKAKAQQEFEQQFSKCGDSYYSIVTRKSVFSTDKPQPLQIRQLKNLTFRVVREDKLDESDKLNGIEWSGLVIAEYDAQRFYDTESKRWGSWLPFVEAKLESLSFLVTKTKHGFSISKEGKLRDIYTNFEKPDCANIQTN